MFLLAELILYILILTTGGTFLRYCCFSAIVLCFLYALCHFKCGSKLIIGALACTVVADYFLVLCSPIEQLWGMLFFLAAQLQYAVLLHRTYARKWVLYVRLALTVAAVTITCLVLRENTDALALISMCYYANLITNILTAFLQFKRCRLLSIGFVLFLLCDTVIGLQSASGVYRPIHEDSLIYRIIFMDFFLSWFFYLPSQVLIALSVKRPK